MLSSSELEEILVTALTSGADFAEIFIEENNATSLRFDDGKLEAINSGIDAGAGIRLIADNRIYYASSSETSFAALLSSAKRLAQALNGKKKIKTVTLVPQLSTSTFQVIRRPGEVAIEEKIAVVETLNRSARSVSSKIRQVTSSYADTNQAVTIANSNGVYIEDNRVRTRYFVNVVAEENGILQTGYEAPGGTCGFELIHQFPPEAEAIRAAERAVLMLSAKPAPAGKMPVILTSSAGGTLIHEAIGHGLEADFIVKGVSVYAGKIGQQVASKLVTVVDDGSFFNKYGAFRFDDEGNPGKRNVVIENGILKGYLTDRFNAKILGLPFSGNGRRESFRTKPVPRMTNTYIERGNTPPEEIIHSIKTGLLVRKMGGGQVNVVSGDFVFDATECYQIENG